MAFRFVQNFGPKLKNILLNTILARISLWAGALVQWLQEETHVPEVVSSNPGTINQMCLFETTKNK